jgi:hypothetical protein
MLQIWILTVGVEYKVPMFTSVKIQFHTASHIHFYLSSLCQVIHLQSYTSLNEMTGWLCMMNWKGLGRK